MPSPSQSAKKLTPTNTSSKQSIREGGPDIPTPPHKRILDQEEFDRRLKAKQITFGKKRSLSLASFRLPTRRKVRLPIEKLGNKLNLGIASGSPKSPKEGKLTKASKPDKDQLYLEKYKARGELDLLNLDSLINVDDV